MTFQSTGLTPAARTSISTRPGPTFGSGTSPTVSRELSDAYES